MIFSAMLGRERATKDSRARRIVLAVAFATRGGLAAAAAMLLTAVGPLAAVDVPAVVPLTSPAALQDYDWTGFSAGGHLSYAWGNSNWVASTIAPPTPSISGSLGLTQSVHLDDEAGSLGGSAESAIGGDHSSARINASKYLFSLYHFQTVVWSHSIEQF
jgi:hypothetical protein